MTSLLAASRQDPAATYGLHARTETVRLGAPAFARLKCALWQSNPPIFFRSGLVSADPETLIRKATHKYYDVRAVQAALAAESELSSLLAHGRKGQGSGGIGDKRGRNCPTWAIGVNSRPGTEYLAERTLPISSFIQESPDGERRLVRPFVPSL